MKQIAFLLVAVAALAGLAAMTVPISLRADDSGAPTFVTKIPPGFRDWKLISVAHEEGNLNSFAAVLGNDLAIKAYRDGKLPFPDGAIIAALHYGHVASDENDRVFGQSQSFVAGAATNIQFMVKDSKKVATTDLTPFSCSGYNPQTLFTNRPPQPFLRYYLPARRSLFQRLARFMIVNPVNRTVFNGLRSNVEKSRLGQKPVTIIFNYFSLIPNHLPKY